MRDITAQLARLLHLVLRGDRHRYPWVQAAAAASGRGGQSRRRLRRPTSARPEAGAGGARVGRDRHSRRRRGRANSPGAELWPRPTTHPHDAQQKNNVPGTASTAPRLVSVRLNPQGPVSGLTPFVPSPLRPLAWAEQAFPPAPRLFSFTLPRCERPVYPAPPRPRRSSFSWGETDERPLFGALPPLNRTLSPLPHSSSPFFLSLGLLTTRLCVL